MWKHAIYFLYAISCDRIVVLAVRQCKYSNPVFIYHLHIFRGKESGWGQIHSLPLILQDTWSHLRVLSTLCPSPWYLSHGLGDGRSFPSCTSTAPGGMMPSYPLTRAWKGLETCANLHPSQTTRLPLGETVSPDIPPSSVMELLILTGSLCINYSNIKKHIIRPPLQLHLPWWPSFRQWNISRRVTQ